MNQSPLNISNSASTNNKVMKTMPSGLVRQVRNHVCKKTSKFCLSHKRFFFVLAFVALVLTRIRLLLQYDQNIKPPLFSTLSRSTIKTLPTRICNSPEKNVPFPLEGCGNDFTLNKNGDEIYGGISRTTGKNCGLCKDNRTAIFFSEIAAALNSYIEQNSCQNLIVYGAAFGNSHFRKFYQKKEEKKFLNRWFRRFWEQNKTNDEKCFFQFVLAEDLRNYHSGPKASFNLDADYLRDPISPNKGGHIFIPIDSTRLPYKSMRRNTKLFKLHGPSLLFPSVKRVIWKDAKLGDGSSFNIGLSNYDDFYQYYQQKISTSGSCVSFMSLPKHINTIGNASFGAKYKDHCRTVIRANDTGKRKGAVSDSSYSLVEQCDYYQKVMDYYNDQNDLKPNLNDGLIDSALILWNRENNSCRRFGADLACTWSDEIHCFSDRDQISFPHVLNQLNLRKNCALKHEDPENLSRIFVHDGDDKSEKIKDGAPIVSMTNGKCHWYYTQSGKCTVNNARIAIIVAGTFERYFLESSVQNLITPLIKQGYEVDYYLSITTDKAKAYRSSSNYMQNIIWDPVYGSHEMPSYVQIKKVTRDMIKGCCARLAKFTLQGQIDLDKDALLQEHRAKAAILYPEEDPDLRFPILDIRNNAKGRTVNANRNLLRMHLSIQNLWNSLTKVENKENFKYDRVMFLRDDTFWVKSFDMNNLLSTADHDLLYLSCDAREPKMAKNEMNDHALIVSRNVAALFGKYYSNLFLTDIEKCLDTVPATIRTSKLRGCNSEMILNWMINNFNVDAKGVGQSLIPFERSVHLRTGSYFNYDENICLHKYCQSSKNRLDTSGYQRCADVEFDS